MHESITARVVVPVADVEDARETATALEPYDVDEVVVVHVVEKGGGVPDKTPVEQSESVAEEAFAAFRSVHPAARTRTAYGRDVVERIVDVADEVDATAIAFLPRGGSRIVQFLAGDRSLRLVTESHLPVVSLVSPGEGPGTDDATAGGEADDAGR